MKMSHRILTAMDSCHLQTSAVKIVSEGTVEVSSHVSSVESVVTRVCKSMRTRALNSPFSSCTVASVATNKIRCLAKARS